LIPLYVIDSSVFNKLYLNEQDREIALQLFEQASKENVILIAPKLLQYEVIATAQYNQLPIDTIWDLLQQQVGRNLNLVEPTLKHWNKAIKIIQIGHIKSGYPSIYDTIFHAIAITEGGTLITADKRHFVKVKKQKHIMMLSDFKNHI